jgi:hypothetical protein
MAASRQAAPETGKVSEIFATTRRLKRPKRRADLHHVVWRLLKAQNLLGFAHGEPGKHPFSCRFSVLFLFLSFFHIHLPLKKFWPSEAKSKISFFLRFKPKKFSNFAKKE